MAFLIRIFLNLFVHKVSKKQEQPPDVSIMKTNENNKNENKFAKYTGNNLCRGLF